MRESVIKHGKIAETGSGKPGDPKMIVLLEVPEPDDDD